jgi:hypothetical protein
MMRLIDQPTGTGDLYENGQFRGPVHYRLNVYQQYDEGRDEAVVGVQHIEDRIGPPGRSISVISGTAARNSY